MEVENIMINPAKDRLGVGSTGSEILERAEKRQLSPDGLVRLKKTV